GTGAFEIKSSAIETALATSNVTIAATSNIDVDTAIDSTGVAESSGRSLELDAPPINLGADIHLNDATRTIGRHARLESSVALNTVGTGSGGAINFTGTIDGTSPGLQDLTLTSGSGAIQIGGAVGSATALGALSSASAAAAVTLAGSVSAGSVNVAGTT